KRARLQKELTFQDLYENQELFDEDDDEDGDWDPSQLQKCVEVIKWLCKNCTMDNINDDVCCRICGEHKDSKILSLGHFASPFAPDEDLNEIQPTIKGLRGEYAC
ncbi:histone deacetylase 15-like, partial [Trifolium medium]|nr:histone deacetylase 15-like [Trifolium medium]